MLETVSKKAPALKDAPNATSPITAQPHIHLRTCRPEEDAVIKLVLSVYQLAELFFSLLSVYSTYPSYFFITSFSLYSHLDFQSFLKARGCIYFLVSSFKSQRISFEHRQHAHLKSCVLELSLGFCNKGWGVGSLMTHSFIFSTYKPASDCCIIYARAQHTQSILHLDLTQSLLTLPNFLKAARYEENKKTTNVQILQLHDMC